jgi:3-oxoacyl-[acyl-carrier-protein] synthase II
VNVEPLAVTGLGVVSPIGVGEEAFFAALADGRSFQPPSTWSGAADPLLSRLPEEQRSRVAMVGELPPLALKRSRPHRLPRLSSLLIAAAQQALGAANPSCAPERIGVIFATGLGTASDATTFVRSYLDGGAEAASPLLFSHATTNACAGQLAIECDLRGVNVTINHRDASPLSALIIATQLLTLRRADVILLAAADELSPILLHGCARLGALTPTVLRPYDCARDGLVPGEAAAVLVLERLADARARSAPVRARITRVAEASDSRPRLGWNAAEAAGEPRGAVRALREAVLPGTRVDWVAGGGNGTTLDDLELRALTVAFEGRPPPTSSIIGQTGECLSSAALRLIAAVWALEHQRIPGTVGLVTPPASAEHFLVREGRAAALSSVLVASLSQGGANAVVGLERG